MSEELGTRHRVSSQVLLNMHLRLSIIKTYVIIKAVNVVSFFSKMELLEVK